MRASIAIALATTLAVTSAISTAPVGRAITVPTDTTWLLNSKADELAAQLPPVPLTVPLKRSPKPTPSRTFAPTALTEQFFRDDQSLAQGKPGTLVGKRVVDNNFSSISSSTTYQLRFRTRDSRGYPMLGTATLIIPNRLITNNIFVYNAFVDAAGQQCSPGQMLANVNVMDAPGLFNIVVAQSVAAAGVPVLMPDVSGPYGGFTINRMSSHVVADSMRATMRAFPQFKKSFFDLFGISGGAIVNGYFAANQPYYAPELTKHIKRVVVVAGAWNMISQGHFFGLYDKDQLSTPYTSFLLASMIGMMREYPKEMQPLWDTYLTPHGKTLFSQAKNRCLAGAVTVGINSSRSDILKPSVNKSRVFTTMVKAGKDASVLYYPGVPKTKVLIVRGMADEMLPQWAEENRVIEKWRKKGTNVTRVLLPAEHLTVAGMGSSIVASIIASDLLR